MRIDVASETSDHTALAAVTAFERAMLELESLEDPDVKAALGRVKTCSLWSDCGGHFRAEIFFAHVLAELPARHPTWRIRFSRFLERHGKTCTDGHFRDLRLFLREAALIKDVLKAEQFVDAMLTQFERREAERRVLMPKCAPRHYSIVLRDFREPDRIYKRMRFPQLQSTYCVEAGPHLGPSDTPGRYRVANCYFSDVFDGEANT